MNDSFDFDVAFSFAGENRAYVDHVAQILRDRGLRVFYDDFLQVELWGKDLYVFLREVYQHRAKYTVMFASRPYAEKRWPNHERESAQARALEENREYILPARFDDTPIPGLTPTTAYVDLRTKTPAEFAVIILEKLKGSRSAAGRWSNPQHAFIMHAAAKGEVNIEYTVTRKRSLKELVRALPSDSQEHEYFSTTPALLNAFPDYRFNCWGVSRHAAPSFDQTEIGDLVLFLGRLHEDAAIGQIGIVKVKCPIECPIASRILWPKADPTKSYPLLFFFDTEVGHRSWAEFTADIGMPGWNPRGWYKKIGTHRFEAYGGVKGYLRFLRSACGFRRLEH
jgi:TIR domain-containing protein